MTQHTSRFFITLVLLSIPHPSPADICYQDDGEQHYDCARLKRADKNLNSEYKNLSSALDSNQIALLKSSQRRWIIWRDNQCNKSIEKSSCTNSSCEAVNFNNCMSELTDRRAKELSGFSKNIADAAGKRFEFQNK